MSSSVTFRVRLRETNVFVGHVSGEVVLAPRAGRSENFFESSPPLLIARDEYFFCRFFLLFFAIFFFGNF